MPDHLKINLTLTELCVLINYYGLYDWIEIKMNCDFNDEKMMKTWKLPGVWVAEDTGRLDGVPITLEDAGLGLRLERDDLEIRLDDLEDFEIREEDRERRLEGLEIRDESRTEFEILDEFRVGLTDLKWWND